MLPLEAVPDDSSRQSKEIVAPERPSEEELRGLAAHLVSVREEERARIAREIHDQLGQALTALQLDLAWVRRRLARCDGSAAPREIRDRLRAMSGLVDETMLSMRRIVTDLRPVVLDQLGLSAAIEWQAREFEARTGVRCLLRSSIRDRRFDPEISTAVFRIFQETLTNAARHSEARRVTVRLSVKRGVLRLEVKDNGRGIPQEAVGSRKSMGLMGMRERALLHGGVVVVSGVPGRGTSVRVRIPLAAAARETPNREVGP